MIISLLLDGSVESVDPPPQHDLSSSGSPRKRRGHSTDSPSNIGQSLCVVDSIHIHALTFCSKETQTANSTQTAQVAQVYA